MRLLCLLTMLALLSPAAVLAGNTESEIEYLIASIGDSNCTFVRNGSRHDAEDAEDHLRMKYRRGKRYATSAELFIERLASKSSMSGKLYTMECPDSETVPSGEWLTARLHEYRAQVSNSQ
ncbi:MAG: DUF5329 domain-containing protein [Gammaproteobacteria bacterium]|nr:DUF5329 domain-containing protein [Gammaproteobacteria bacterium]